MKMVYLNHYKIFLDILTNRSYCEYNIIRILLSISHTSKSNLSLLALSFLGGSLAVFYCCFFLQAPGAGVVFCI